MSDRVLQLYAGAIYYRNEFEARNARMAAEACNYILTRRQAEFALDCIQQAPNESMYLVEDLFDTPLFDRRSKLIRLTPEGERLLARAYRLISLNDETWQLMSRPAYTGEIRLGVPLDVIRPMLPPILRRFSREHPKIQLTMVGDTTGNLLGALKNGDIDLTLTTESQAGRGEALLLSDQLVWIGAQNGEACHKSPLPVSLGSDSCAFRAPTLEALNKAQIDWLAICGQGNLDAILATIEADMAVAPYLASLVPENLVAIAADVGLPALPTCHITLRLPDSGGT